MTTSSSLSDASSTAEGLGKASRKPRMAFLIVGPPVVRLQGHISCQCPRSGMHHLQAVRGAS